jgi:D-aminopeptidase
VTASGRRRLRALGFRVGDLATGPRNAISDIAGVRVGHVTLIRDTAPGAAVRTGVTAIVPPADVFAAKLPAASYVLNGHGKALGLVQIDELGTLETPILLTNTLSVGAIAEGVVRWTLGRHGDARTVNAVVAECNDGYLNDIRGLHVRPDHARDAIEAATADVAEGSVGAGTGMSCFGYKGGIGTSSRVAEHTLGALVLANFGRARDLALHGWLLRGAVADTGASAGDDGSCIVVLATDAPLDARQLRRLAVRGALGIARAGGYAANRSGDIVIAFSTDPDGARLRDESAEMDDLFRMAPDAVLESILNALCVADRMVGHEGHVREGFPYARLEN